MPAFTPHARPAVAIAGDGTLAAIVDGERAVVLELPGGAPFAELELETDAQVGWVGAPPRLIVVAGRSIRLVDPHGGRTVARLELEQPVKLRACAGAQALVSGAATSSTITATDAGLVQHPLAWRTVPACAGAAGTAMVVAFGETIEEWDAASRMPRRRHKLPEAQAILAIGGTERVLWRHASPRRIDVIALVDRGQPRAHDLPEPIAHVAGHPHSDLVACVGAESGKVYIVDLDGRTRLRTLSPEGLDRTDAAGLIAGRITGVLAARAGAPVAIISLDDTPIDVETAVTTPPPGLADALATKWRDDLVVWARDRSITAPPAALAIDQLAARFGVAAELAPVVAALYAAHLLGQPGLAPADIARLAGGRWPEALGSGTLSALGLTRHEASRVLLAAPILRALDDLPPATGKLVGEGGRGTAFLDGPHAVVARGMSTAMLAGRYASRGLILASRDDADPAELFLEARARGAVPMLRIVADDLLEAGSDPAILVVDDDETADQLGVPRL